MNLTRLLSAFLSLALLSGALAVEGGPVVVAPLQGEVSSAQFLFLRRALKEAEQEGASAFVIEMDTYGGEGQAAIDIMDALLKTGVPTYTYINTKALSAGALIALASQHIYMAPTGVIGAAAPVQSDGQDLSRTMSDKTVSAFSAMGRAAAQKAGHNPDLADAFIRKEMELKLGDVVIDRPDSLLTLSASEAAREIEGKPVLSAGTVSSLEEMLKQAGLSAAIRRVEPTGFERLARLLTNLAPLLLVGGILGAYLEIKTPGFGVAGIASTLCFTLFFTGGYLAGLAGWEAIVFFFLGIALILSELFLHPGTILPGIIGFFLTLGSLVWAMIDRYPGQGWWPTSAMLVRPLLNLTLAFAVATVTIYFLARLFPQTSLYRHIVLGEVVPSVERLPAGHLQTGLQPGMQGTARTTLRPSGKAEFDGQLVDVVSQGDLVPAGVALRILAVEGPRIVVVAV